MANKKKNYSVQFKTKVALEAVKEYLTISEIASKYEVHPNLVTQWKKKLIEGSEAVFEDKRKKKQNTEEELVDNLYRQIGQMKYEIDWLKKKTGL